jgi:transcriptional regulator with XRE-family HTH domain
MSREIGARIRAARKAAGLSQEKLAKSVEGLSASALGKAERGEKALSSEQLEAVARALGVPPETLLENAEAEDVAASSPAGESAAPMTLTPEEQELLAAYREANAETKKVAVSALKGENSHAPNIMDIVAGMMSGNGGGNPLADLMRRGESGENPMAGMIGKLMDMMGGEAK